MLLQFPRRTHQRRYIVADQLSDDRPARGIGRNRPENDPLQTRGSINAEVLREIEVRPAIGRHQVPKQVVGDILHRRQRQHWPRTGQEREDTFRSRAIARREPGGRTDCDLLFRFCRFTWLLHDPIRTVLVSHPS